MAGASQLATTMMPSAAHHGHRSAGRRRNAYPSLHRHHHLAVLVWQRAPPLSHRADIGAALPIGRASAPRAAPTACRQGRPAGQRRLSMPGEPELAASKAGGRRRSCAWSSRRCAAHARRRAADNEPRPVRQVEDCGSNSAGEGDDGLASPAAPNSRFTGREVLHQWRGVPWQRRIRCYIGQAYRRWRTPRRRDPRARCPDARA